MSRRSFSLGAGILAAAMAIASACAFPEPEIVADGPGARAPETDAGLASDASVVDSVFAIDGNQSGTFVTCKPSLVLGIACAVKSTETVTRGCR